MLQAVGEKVLTDLVEKADFNKNKVPDKKELQPVVSQMVAGANDIAASIDYLKASTALEQINKESAIVLSRVGPLVTKDAMSKGVDVSALLAALLKEDSRIALAHIIIAAQELTGSIDHAKLQKGLTEFGDAKTRLEAFAAGEKPKELPEAKSAKK